MLLLLLALVQDAVTVTAPAHDKERRYVLLEAKLAGSGPFRARDKDAGTLLAAQGDGAVVRWLVPSIPAGAKRTFVVEKGEAAGATTLTMSESDGVVSIKAPDREITRWHPGAGIANKKPCFYPLTGHGVNVLRAHPFEDRAGEAKDHPHHTGIYHAFGDVNGTEYWSKTNIVNRKATRDAGPAYARIRAENAWGEDLVETQDVFVLNAGADVVMDWTITLTAAVDVTLGKNAKMAKEGSFAVRVGTELTRKGDAPEMMSDALGNKGEKAIRAAAAPWVDYSGEIDGKKVGVAVMDHPASFRAPTNWHVRAYGLFAANPWLVRGESALKKGESMTLRYRVYVHGGGPEDGKVEQVYAGFTNAKTE
ncbi:MAG TPA: PmoA family protein [Planctomycetota bacterium]